MLDSGLAAVPIRLILQCYSIRCYATVELIQVDPTGATVEVSQKREINRKNERFALQ